MIGTCKACGRKGPRMKTAVAYASNRGGGKLICRNRNACIRRQDKQYREKRGL